MPLVGEGDSAVHAERAQLPGGVFGDKVYVCLGDILEGFGVVVIPFDVEPDFTIPFENINSAAYATPYYRRQNSVDDFTSVFFILLSILQTKTS